MSERKDRGWEDIRKQPAYKAGQRARRLAKDPNTTARFVRDHVGKEYKKLDKVHRQIFRSGWCDR